MTISTGSMQPQVTRTKLKANSLSSPQSEVGTSSGSTSTPKPNQYFPKYSMGNLDGTAAQKKGLGTAANVLNSTLRRGEAYHPNYTSQMKGPASADYYDSISYGGYQQVGSVANGNYSQMGQNLAQPVLNMNQSSRTDISSDFNTTNQVLSNALGRDQSFHSNYTNNLAGPATGDFYNNQAYAGLNTVGRLAGGNYDWVQHNLNNPIKTMHSNGLNAIKDSYSATNGVVEQILGQQQSFHDDYTSRLAGPATGEYYNNEQYSDLDSVGAIAGGNYDWVKHNLNDPIKTLNSRGRQDVVQTLKQTDGVVSDAIGREQSFHDDYTSQMRGPASGEFYDNQSYGELGKVGAIAGGNYNWVEHNLNDPIKTLNSKGRNDIKEAYGATDDVVERALNRDQAFHQDYTSKLAGPATGEFYSNQGYGDLETVGGLMGEDYQRLEESLQSPIHQQHADAMTDIKNVFGGNGLYGSTGRGMMSDAMATQNNATQEALAGATAQRYGMEMQDRSQRMGENLSAWQAGASAADQKNAYSQDKIQFDLDQRQKEADFKNQKLAQKAQYQDDKSAWEDAQDAQDFAMASQAGSLKSGALQAQNLATQSALANATAERYNIEAQDRARLMDQNQSMWQVGAAQADQQNAYASDKMQFDLDQRQKQNDFYNQQLAQEAQYHDDKNVWQDEQDAQNFSMSSQAADMRLNALQTQNLATQQQLGDAAVQRYNIEAQDRARLADQNMNQWQAGMAGTDQRNAYAADKIQFDLDQQQRLNDFHNQKLQQKAQYQDDQNAWQNEQNLMQFDVASQAGGMMSNALQTQNLATQSQLGQAATQRYNLEMQDRSQQMDQNMNQWQAGVTGTDQQNAYNKDRMQWDIDQQQLLNDFTNQKLGLNAQYQDDKNAWENQQHQMDFDMASQAGGMMSGAHQSQNLATQSLLADAAKDRYGFELEDRGLSIDDNMNAWKTGAASVDQLNAYNQGMTNWNLAQQQNKTDFYNQQLERNANYRDELNAWRTNQDELNFQRALQLAGMGNSSAAAQTQADIAAANRSALSEQALWTGGGQLLGGLMSLPTGNGNSLGGDMFSGLGSWVNSLWS